jgi:hypothetical protein
LSGSIPFTGRAAFSLLTLKEHHTMTEKIQEAIRIWGDNVVNTVIMVVDLSDADAAYSHFQDMDSEEYAECVVYLYFEAD